MMDYRKVGQRFKGDYGDLNDASRPCQRCGLPLKRGNHASAEQCIDLLRDELGPLELRKSPSDRGANAASAASFA